MHRKRVGTFLPGATNMLGEKMMGLAIGPLHVQRNILIDAPHRQ